MKLWIRAAASPLLLVGAWRSFTWTVCTSRLKVHFNGLRFSEKNFIFLHANLMLWGSNLLLSSSTEYESSLTYLAQCTHEVPSHALKNRLFILMEVSIWPKINCQIFPQLLPLNLNWLKTNISSPSLQKFLDKAFLLCNYYKIVSLFVIWNITPS